MQQDDGGVGGGIGFGLPRAARAVKVLLLLNVAVFILQLFPRPNEFLVAHFGVTVGAFWQVWRYVTFQFLHGDFWHIVLNMLGLYLLGSPLEDAWGTRRFVYFYLTCGIAAGVTYVLIGAAADLPANWPIIGASGGVVGILLACAVLFPEFKLIFLFFPVPIRLACLIIFGGMVVIVLQSLGRGQTAPAMSDVAHLGGAVMAAAWVWLIPRLATKFRLRVRRGPWQQKLDAQRRQETQIDAILDKIRQKGLDSLSWREKRALREASRRQQEEDRKIDRMG